jgi:ATP-dependent DNA helicase PIF1
MLKQSITLYKLNEEQEAVMCEINKKHNVFVTGPGGTGKSFLIKHIKRSLEEKNKVVAVTSLTGMASLLIGEGVRTIHSWSGIGIGNRSVDDYFNFIRVKNKKAREAWRKTDVLIIDEISMISSKVYSVLRDIKKIYQFKFIMIEICTILFFF